MATRPCSDLHLTKESPSCKQILLLCAIRLLGQELQVTGSVGADLGLSFLRVPLSYSSPGLPGPSYESCLTVTPGNHVEPVSLEKPCPRRVAMPRAWRPWHSSALLLP